MELYLKKITIILIIFFNTLIFALPTENSNKFTSDEQQWIDKKIPITYVYDIDWEPFEWKNNVNTHSELLPIYLISFLKNQMSSLKPYIQIVGKKLFY